MRWPIVQMWISGAMHRSHPYPSHGRVTVKIWSQYLQYSATISKVILKFSSFTLRLQCPCWKPTIYRRFVDTFSRYDLFWWLVSEKIASCTALRAVMVHSERRIALLLASFNVALPSERENPSWIDWTIEISPSIRWVLLGWFPARMSRFRVSHHANYCARRSLASYWPVVTTCSHFGARFRRRHMPRGTARAPPQVPQHFDSARAIGSLFAPPVDLISFTLYGSD